MSVPATTPLSYNLYVQQIGILAVATTAETAGVWAFTDAPLQGIINQALNYAELRIQRDIDFLQAKSSNNYTLTAGIATLSIPINDFLMLETLEIVQSSSGAVVNSCPLTPVSKELIQNCYAGLSCAGTPRFFAVTGSTFGDGADTNFNVLFGPPPNYAYTLRAYGVIRLPTLATYATSGPADASYTYISQFLPDMLLMASMIYVSAFQRQFSSTSDDPAMAMSYEKQYQALRLGAISEENRKKFLESGWSSYSTPVSATSSR
jgi:hypothetical protein